MRPLPALLRSLAPAALLAGAPLAAMAQMAVCSSDGQPPPRALYERFLSADCESCWADVPAAAPGDAALLLDWIVPGRSGDDAPLSAAATRDALDRLEALGRTPPGTTDTAVSDVAPAGAAPGRLRVSLGPPLNDYVGTTIALVPAPVRGGARPLRPGARYTFTLLLIQTVPASSEGNAAPRHLVRNALQGTWVAGAGRVQTGWSELRPMRVPDGADVQRLGVAGWLQDADGTVIAAAQARCAAGADAAATGNAAK
ncbi:hypothetical protein [Paracidovorax wautersii]|uniref:Uncharacterized protein n=1 Tax=Paracidovorax wautersii TaxID=1177982 RepID=A0ABU1IBJ3_9BURK|nr:hypothetical protein [Paracidovorax wautersii]MDR6214601.1 hypothetical protein [Paracidovorax wautersii]